MRRKQDRDVQIHAAVTIMGNANNVPVIGEKPVEVAQFAVQLDEKFAPFTRKQFEIAFRGLMEHCLEKARAANLLRAGE
jgi:hypothetical protein